MILGRVSSSEKLDSHSPSLGLHTLCYVICILSMVNIRLAFVIITFIICNVVDDDCIEIDSWKISRVLVRTVTGPCND